MSISQRKNYTAEWRMSDESVIVLDDLLSAAQPRSVLELGPGWSSWFLYDHALENNGLVYTVDHEGEHAEKHRAAGSFTMSANSTTLLNISLMSSYSTGRWKGGRLPKRWIFTHPLVGKIPYG